MYRIRKVFPPIHFYIQKMLKHHHCFPSLFLMICSILISVSSCSMFFAILSLLPFSTIEIKRPTTFYNNRSNLIIQYSTMFFIKCAIHHTRQICAEVIIGGKRFCATRRFSPCLELPNSARLSFEKR